MFQTLKNWYNSFWAGLKNSGTILLARLEAVIGIIIAVGASLDWSPLFAAGVDTGFTWKQALTLGTIMVAKGIATEVIRRWNTKTVDNHLLPDNK